MNGAAEPVIEVTSPSAEAARRVLRAYFEDIVGRYHGRAATAAEVDEAMRREPSDDLAPPTGLLLLAYGEDGVLGCTGLRVAFDQGHGVGEVTRVFVVPAARRRGLGARLLAGLEEHARRLGVSVLRLDTRRDLTEARQLYATRGYREVAHPYKRQYADHWFEKTLD